MKKDWSIKEKWKIWKLKWGKDYKKENLVKKFQKWINFLKKLFNKVISTNYIQTFKVDSKNIML